MEEKQVPGQTMLENFTNDVFTLKRHEMFPAHTTPEIFENSVFKTFSVHFKTQIPPVSKAFSKISVFVTD